MAIKDRNDHKVDQCQPCLQAGRAYGLPEITCKPWRT